MITIVLLLMLFDITMNIEKESDVFENVEDNRRN